MAYLVKEGLDQPLIDLLPIDPQPRSIGLQYSRVTQAASGAVIREAPYVELQWSVIESQSQYEDLLEQFGLDALTSANVTVTVPNDLFASTRMNGRAVRPVAGETVTRQDYFLRDVTIVIKDLEAAS